MRVHNYKLGLYNIEDKSFQDIVQFKEVDEPNISTLEIPEENVIKYLKNVRRETTDFSVYKLAIQIDGTWYIDYKNEHFELQYAYNTYLTRSFVFLRFLYEAILNNEDLSNYTLNVKEVNDCT